jgi:hypothetical protein
MLTLQTRRLDNNQSSSMVHKFHKPIQQNIVTNYGWVAWLITRRGFGLVKEFIRPLNYNLATDYSYWTEALLDLSIPSSVCRLSTVDLPHTYMSVVSPSLERTAKRLPTVTVALLRPEPRLFVTAVTCLRLVTPDMPQYIGMTPDAKLWWKEHIEKKSDGINIKFRKMYWLLGCNSELSVHNKLIIQALIFFSLSIKNSNLVLH